MALSKLAEWQVPFKVHVVGQRFRQVPAVFAEIKQALPGYIGRWEYIESVEEYRSLLQKSDVVLSTAIHDYQGIAVLEGVAAGCQPVVPERLAYPELFASRYRYPSFENNPEKEAQGLAKHLKALAEDKQNDRLRNGPNVRGLSWNSLKSGYRDWLEATAVIKQRQVRAGSLLPEQ